MPTANGCPSVLLVALAALPAKKGNAAWYTSAVSSSNPTTVVRGRTSFNADLGAWQVGQVTNMGYMFHSAAKFNLVLCWNLTGKITTGMFAGSSGSADPISAKCSCIAGTFWNGTACASCSPGSFSLGKSFSCTACVAGNFQASSGASFCDSCTPGKYSSGEGRVSNCTDLCSTGSYSLSGASICTACASGTYQNTTGASSCIRCPITTYQPLNGKATCISCPSGEYGASTGAVACTPCQKGTYQNSIGSLSCQACSAGNYQSSTGQLDCLSCGAGRYSSSTGRESECSDACSAGKFSATGATSCTSCSAGQYQPSAGQSDCLTCTDGSVSEAGAASCILCSVPACAQAGFFLNCSALEYSSECYVNCTCIACPVGTASSSALALSSDSCTPCGPGRAASSPGLQACESCETGRFASDNASDAGGGLITQVFSGATSCNECPPGHFTPTLATVVCQACESGRYSPVGASTCSLCREGYFRTASGICVPCPEHATCQREPGAALAAPSEGYWLNTKSLDTFSGSGVDLYLCPRDTCKGSDPEESPACWSPANVAECDSDELLCTPGAEGPLCSSCSSGHVYSSTTRQCAMCGEFDPRPLSVLGAVLVLGAMITVARHNRLGLPLAMKASWLLGVFSHIDSGMCRVVWSSFQIVYSTAWSLGVTFPEPFATFVSSLSWLSFDVLSLECAFPNSDYLISVYAWSALPILALVASGAVFVLRSWWAEDHDLDKHRVVLQRQHADFSILITYLLLPPVSRRQFQALDCVSVAGGSYLRVDTSIDCASARFRTF